MYNILKSNGGKDALTYRPTNSIQALNHVPSTKKFKSKKVISTFKPSNVKTQDKYLLDSTNTPREIPAAPLTKEIICILTVKLDGGKNP